MDETQKSDDRYVEDTTFCSPHFQDGVHGFGDLYNCRDPKVVGHNLFKTNKIPVEHLRITPVKNCDYTLTHVKNELEAAESLNIDGYLSLDLLLSIIQLEGNVKFKKDSSDQTQSETVSLRYINENCRIDVNFPIGSLINEHVLQMILDRKIEATHVVGGMIIGCSVTSLIEIRKKEFKKNKEVSGKLGLNRDNSDKKNKNDKKNLGNQKEIKKTSKWGWLNKLLGSFSGEIKAEWEKTEKNDELDIKISCKARPMPEDLAPPSSVKELFELIENMPSAMQKETHFNISSENSRYYGVPIRFILYPIAQIENVKIAKLYKKLEDQFMKKFQDMLAKAFEIQQYNYIQKLILMENRRLVFLLGKKSDFSHKVKTLEQELKQIGEEFVSRSRNQLKEYKYGKSDSEALEIIIKEFDASTAGSVETRIQDLVDDGALEISLAQGTDESFIKRLTDEREKLIWIQDESGPKIIFSIGDGCPKTTISSFHQLASPLSSIGMKMALVMPSIAKEVKLSLIIEDQEVSFKDSEVQKAVEILCADFRIGNQTRADFFALIGAIKGLEFPVHRDSLSKLESTLETMIELLKDYNQFHFVDSINDFQRLIRKLPNQHVAFCLPIDAPETALDFFQTWKNYKIKNVTWIVSNFNIHEEQEAPLLLVLSRTEVLAICLDRLDLMILEEEIKKTPEVHDIKFDLFSVDQLKNSLYKLRVSSAFRFSSCVVPNSIRATDTNRSITETNSEITEFLSFVRDSLKSDELLLLSAVAKMTVYDFPTLASTLKKCGWNDISKNFAEECFKKELFLETITEIEKWLADDSLKNEIDEAETSLSDDTNLSMEKCFRACAMVANHSHCPVGFKIELKECGQSGKAESVQQIEVVLKKLKKCTESHFSFLHVKVLLAGLRVFISSERPVNTLTKILVSEYYNNLKLEIPDFIGMEKFIQNNQIYQLLQQASPFKYTDKWLRTLFKGINDLQNLEDHATLTKLLHTLSEADVCSKMDYVRQLWSNEKLFYLIRSCLNSKQNNEFTLLHSIDKWIQNTEGKFNMPKDIQEKLDSLDIVATETFSSAEDVKCFLEKKINEDDTPWYFCKTLEKAMRNNQTLESDLIRMGAAIHWNAELKIFENYWSQKNMKQALENLKEASKPKKTLSTTAGIDFQLGLVTSLLAKKQDSSTICQEHIFSKFIPVMGTEFNRISDTDYLMVRTTIDHPCKPNGAPLPSLLPYLLQQIKLWDGNILKVSRISKLLNAHDEEDKESCSGDPFESETTISTGIAETNSDIRPSPSRLDCLAYILNAVESTVAQEILRILSKFPLSLSMIIPDIRNENKYIVTLPLLKNIVIRWETRQKVQETKPTVIEELPEVGKIIENHLFSSPFHLIVAVRIGTHHTGKSQILNQVLSYPYYFSSRAEAGVKTGPPCTLNGTVEFTWLTEETCSDELWKGLLENHYADGKEDLVLLANLHGSVNDFPATVKYLKELACCFVVFLMPGSDQSEWKKFKTQISDKPTQFVRVDHGDPHISTACLTHADTQAQLKNLFRMALTHQAKCENPEQFSLEKPLIYAQSIKTTESESAVELISKYSCSDIRNSMADFLQKGYKGWIDKENLQLIAKSILRIFNHSTRLDLKKAIINLETELTKKSAKESIIPRRQVIEAQRQLQLAKFRVKGKSGDKNSSYSNTEFLNRRLMEEADHVSDSNLGLEHFFRIFGEIYRISLGQCSSNANNIENLPQYYADLLLNGHSLEILNGDTGEIPLDWFRAICRQVHKGQPNLRVYVISIIGIQSSGKSTLLNALFSCRFAVSVGRCSRGLYMRMVFLENQLRKQTGYDAIILIDTEGLASSEKMNERDAERKDRLLATFAMGLSNLTIVNILGEELTSMTEILQIVIVTMARLRQADVKPDMIVVQHLQERNSMKLNEAKLQFINAMKAAFDLVNKCDVDIGATQYACLADLISGIDRPDMFVQFSSFRNGSSVHAPPSESYHNDITQLYQNLLVRAETTSCKLSFDRWFQLVENYWNSVTNEKFALNFKNAKKISDFLHYAQKVASIKEFVGKAFGFHREEISKKKRDEVNDYLSQKKESQLDQLREKQIKETICDLNHVPFDCSLKICVHCKPLRQQIEELLHEVKETEWHKDIDESIKKCIKSKINNELKILEQEFDVLVLHNNVSADTVRLINVEIKEEFKRRHKNTCDGKPEDDDVFQKCSEAVKMPIINKIWDKVKKIAQSKATGAPLMEEIEKAIDSEYGSSHPDMYDDVKKHSSPETLENEYANSRFWGLWNKKLSQQQHLRLIEKIEKFVENVLTDSGHNTKSFKIGTKFEAIMIMTIKHNISDMIQEFVKESDIKLKSEFKHLIHVHTLTTFIKRMEPIHEMWENQNKPIKILLGKEKFYKAEIRTRLEHGFSSASDGYVKAGYIIEAVKRKAVDAGYKIKVESILDNIWMTNSEKVRLQYFEELALEVKEKNVTRALAHFNKPRQSIENWFTQKIETSYSTKKVTEMYEKILVKETNYILNEVKRSDNIRDLETLLIQYDVPQGTDLDSSRSTELTDHDFVTFRDSLGTKIEELFQKLKDESIEYPSASKDDDVMSRLGCTESCPWCGALCWGSRGHDDDKGEIKRHHTCHQPNGLIKTCRLERGQRILDPRSCHNIPNTEFVLGDTKGTSGVPWGTVKIEFSENWKFDSHAIKKFDEMMRWFFQELQEDISKTTKSNPVPKDWLKRFECVDLKLEDILVTVRSVKN